MLSAACSPRRQSQFPIVDAWLHDVNAVLTDSSLNTGTLSLGPSEHSQTPPVSTFQHDPPTSCPRFGPKNGSSGLKRKRAILQEVPFNSTAMAPKLSLVTPKKDTQAKASKKGHIEDQFPDDEDDGIPLNERTPRLQPRRRLGSKVSARSPTRSSQRKVIRQEHESVPAGEQRTAYASALESNVSLAPSSQSHSHPSVVDSHPRSRSPIKSMADLALADKPIHERAFGNDMSELPSDVKELYKILKQASDGEAVLPVAIRHEIAGLAGDMEPLRPYMFEEALLGDDRRRNRLLRELEEITEICNASRKCAQDYVAEPAWNDEVHSRLLRLAVKDFAQVEHQNITSAKIVPDLVPRHISGDILRAKMVDYSINLIPDQSMEAQIRRRLQDEPRDLQTMNQSMYSPIRYRPIAVSIETKTPDASEQQGRIQLSVWEAAYFERIRRLCLGGHVSLTRPSSFISGAQWSVLFSCDKAQHIDLLGKLIIGDTSSLLGAYKVLKGVRLLCWWATTQFKDWLESQIFNF